MAAENEKELQQLRKRLAELSGRSYEHNIYTYTGFLNMAEQDVFYSMPLEDKASGYRLSGGREGCERQMIQFGCPENLGYEEDFPIACVAVKPLMEKFAENLDHRDFLGALMNLGMDRAAIGDIYVEGKSAYVFCTEKIAPYLIDNLNRVRHTDVACVFADAGKELPVKEPEKVCFTVASERVDGIIAKIYHLSRSQSLDLLKGRKVYINGRLNENGSYGMKSGDIVSVRGHGRFLYYGAGHETKKGKWSVSAGIYR